MYYGASSGSFGARGNLWGSVRDFFNRGGFVNGLNPQIVGRIWYVNGNTETDADERKGPVGSDTNPGNSPLAPFATIERVLEFVDCYDVVVLSGVFREQLVSPPGVFDVTFIGAENRPRQATDGGVPTGGGASWLSPDSPTATTPLFRVSEQGWSFYNIQFAPVASSACLHFVRKDTTAEYDGSHGEVNNCYFSAGGADGLGITYTEVRSLVIRNNRFEGLGTGIKGIAGLGVATNHRHLWEDNIFDIETNDIDDGKLDYSVIRRNVFLSTNPIEGGVRMDLAGGVAGRNRVLLNQFSDVAGDVTIAKGYAPGANDVWNNYVAGTAALIVTVPS